MLIKNIERQILGLLCRELYESGDLGFAYTSLEALLIKKQTPFGTVMEYSPSYNKDFLFNVSLEPDGLVITARNKGETFCMGYQDSLKKLHEEGHKMGEMLKRERIALSPVPDKDFIQTFMNATQGSVICLNNNMSVVCVDDTNGNKVFKKQFEGTLSSISVQNFINSETFIINQQSLRDIHYLYSRAYASRTNTADLRISLQSHMGQHVCTDIEQKLSPGTQRNVLVGPLTLHVLKNADNQTQWHDDSGQAIPRDLVGTIFGWAENTLPKIDFAEWNGPTADYGLAAINEETYTQLLAAVKKAAGTQDFESLYSDAMKCAIASNGLMTVTVTDLVADQDNNYIATTFAFKNENNQNMIYRLEYEDNNPSGWLKKATSVSKDEFITFCQKKFTESCRFIENQNEAFLIQAEAKGVPKSKAVKELIDAVSAKEGFNFLGITKERQIQVADEAAALLRNLSDTKEALSALEFADEDDFSHDNGCIYFEK